MSLSGILTAIQTRVAGVAGIGASRVHRGQRVLPRHLLLSAAQEPGATVPRVHLWTVSRHEAPEVQYGLEVTERQYHVWVEGYYQQDDPGAQVQATAVGTDMTSELTFSDLAELVCDGLRGIDSLQGGSLAAHYTPPSLVEWSTRMLGERDCHYCRIEMTVSTVHDVTWT